MEIEHIKLLSRKYLISYSHSKRSFYISRIVTIHAMFFLLCTIQKTYKNLLFSSTHIPSSHQIIPHYIKI